MDQDEVGKKRKAASKEASQESNMPSLDRTLAFVTSTELESGIEVPLEPSLNEELSTEVMSNQEVSRDVSQAPKSNSSAEKEEHLIEENSAEPGNHLDHCYSWKTAGSHIIEGARNQDEEKQELVMLTTSSSSKESRQRLSNITAWAEVQPRVDIKPLQSSQPSNSKAPLLSSVFDHPEDPENAKVMKQIQKRQEQEAKTLAKKSERALKGRQKRAMAKMAAYQLQQSENKSKKCSSKQTEVDQQPAYKKRKIEYDNDYTIDLDELLRLPHRPEDGSKTTEEILDEMEAEIISRQARHDQEMAQVDLEVQWMRIAEEERKGRMQENASRRLRLQSELTEERLRKLFKHITPYLKDIVAGVVASSRHQAFVQSVKTRHALFYTLITDPFSDQQLDWTLEEMSKLWMRNKKEQMENNEYVWKVLLPECFIKFYMEVFGIEQPEAVQRIKETPAVEDD